jgi:transposase-like protein
MISFKMALETSQINKSPLGYLRHSDTPSSHLRECYEASTEFTMVVAKWHVRRTSGAPKALAVALSFCCLLGLQVKYLNNIIEQDYRFIKKTTKPMMGFKAFHSAQATIAGIETAHMI